MAIITRAYSEVQGQIAQASSVNRVVDDLYTLQGGNIDSSNIARSGINSSNFAAGAVDTNALQSQAVVSDKVDYSTVVMMEVFT